MCALVCMHQTMQVGPLNRSQLVWAFGSCGGEQGSFSNLAAIGGCWRRCILVLHRRQWPAQGTNCWLLDLHASTKVMQAFAL